MAVTREREQERERNRESESDSESESECQRERSRESERKRGGGGGMGGERESSFQESLIRVISLSPKIAVSARWSGKGGAAGFEWSHTHKHIRTYTFIHTLQFVFRE